MSLKHYILVNKEPVDVPLMEWGKWLKESKERFIAKDTVNGYLISTVFLGLDYGFGKIPVLFETMVFPILKKDKKPGKIFKKSCKKGDPNYGEDKGQERYCTYKEAEAGHRRWIKKVQRWVK